ncbi:hypothetical protein [Streptomyces cyaneofuscatus]|uniref:hypothetical protein n=1 Tax=Streptomyces cyaneofuscatus TaxID=66883 RepID=UPI0033336524
MIRTPSWPNVSPARDRLQRALRLLDDPTEANLTEARRLATEAAEWVPQLGEDRLCAQARKGWSTSTCLSRSCGRCEPIRLANKARDR